ncbi:MAG: class I SAM-dependent methyltransferase [Rubrobacteraceae bacterium]
MQQKTWLSPPKHDWVQSPLMGDIDYPELDWRWGILLGTAIRDGLLEAVSRKTKPAGEVAGELGLDRRAVFAILSALAELGILDENEDGFRLLDEHHGPLLDDSDASYAGGRVVHRFELIGSWSKIPEILKTGEPVEDRTRPDFAGTPTMAQAMRGGAKESADQISEMAMSRLPKSPRILDVGGGPGANAESFARFGAEVTVFDRPEVIEVTERYLSEAGVSTVCGDMNEELPEGPFEGIYFGNTSHLYGPDENLALFERMRRSLAPGGLLALREFVRGISEDAALFAINMLVLTPGGGTYSAREYESWLTAAGFEEVEVATMPGRTTVLILARNPR